MRTTSATCANKVHTRPKLVHPNARRVHKVPLRQGIRDPVLVSCVVRDSMHLQQGRRFAPSAMTAVTLDQVRMLFTTTGKSYIAWSQKAQTIPLRL